MKSLLYGFDGGRALARLRSTVRPLRRRWHRTGRWLNRCGERLVVIGGAKSSYRSTRACRQGRLVLSSCVQPAPGSATRLGRAARWLSKAQNIRFERPCPFHGFGANGRYRRISPVAAHSGDRLLSEPTAGTQPCRREPLFMSSCPEESHLRTLPDPYVNLSIHTAPDVQPFP